MRRSHPVLGSTKCTVPKKDVSLKTLIAMCLFSGFSFDARSSQARLCKPLRTRSKKWKEREHQAVGMTAILRTQLLLSASSSCCSEEDLPLVFSVLDAVGSTLDGDFGSRRVVRGRDPRRCNRRRRPRVHVIGRIVHSSRGWCSAECAGDLRGPHRRRQGLLRSGTTSALMRLYESSTRAGEDRTCCLVRGRAALLCWHCIRLQLPQLCCNGRMDRMQAVCNMHWVKSVV